MSVTAPSTTLLRATRKSHRSRNRARIAVLAAAVLAAFFAACLLGSFTVTLPDFFRIVTGTDIPGATFIVMQDKLPKAVVALLAGACFGVSGTLFQTMLRNPLASPDIIGISSGASAAAVVAIVVFGVSGVGVSVIACLGAIGVALLIHGLAHGEAVHGHRLVLMGIGVAAVLQAVISFLLTRSDIRTAGDALVWLIGSLNDSTWGSVARIAAAAVVLLPLAGMLSRPLAVLGLGDDTAAGLGLRVDRTRLGLLLVAVLLSAVATAVAGPVAFVAFLSGPIARRLCRGRVSLTVSALVGSLIVLGAHLAGMNLPLDVELPVGVITGALGAPFLLYLLVIAHREGQGG